jgi:hypothetical protein
MTKWILRFRNKITDRIVSEQAYGEPGLPREIEEFFIDSKYFEVSVTAVSVK